MEHYIGLNEYQLRQQKQTPVKYDPAMLINGHVLLCGMSGTGKSHQSMRFLESAESSGVEIDVFDVHEEFERLRGATACRYSQATGYGFNPLVLDTDPHTGGVQNQVNFLVNLVRQVSPQFGAKQEAALRYLLTDTYAANWIFQDNPSSWRRQCITERERERIIAERKYSELRNYYPTLADLESYGRRKVMALTIGGDNKSIAAYEALARVKSKLNSAVTRRNKAVTDEEVQRLENQVIELKAKSIDAYQAFVEAMQTGREMDDVIKYDSVDVLKSVMQRLEILNSTGIFRSNTPPFGDARVRVHQIKSLQTEQQVLFVKLRLREIFERWKRKGPTTELRHVIFLDEAHKYFTEDEDDIINVIAKEARKFGIALWCAAQSPTVFPESFLTNVGATVLLGIHASYWKRAATMLRISEDTLKWIRPKEVLSIKLMRDGQSDPPFTNVVVPNPSTEYGRRAAAVAA